jgi:hypothetical protein
MGARAELLTLVPPPGTTVAPDLLEAVRSVPPSRPTNFPKTGAIAASSSMEGRPTARSCRKADFTRASRDRIAKRSIRHSRFSTTPELRRNPARLPFQRNRATDLCRDSQANLLHLDLFMGIDRCLQHARASKNTGKTKLWTLGTLTPACSEGV